MYTRSSYPQNNRQNGSFDQFEQEQTFRRLRPPRVSAARLEEDWCVGVDGVYMPRRALSHPKLSCSRSVREGSPAPRPGLAGATANCLERKKEDGGVQPQGGATTNETLPPRKHRPVLPSPRRGSSTTPHQVPSPWRHPGRPFLAGQAR